MFENTEAMSVSANFMVEVLVLVLMSERIDLQNAEKKYGQLLSKLPGNESILPENRSLILKFLRDAELGKTIRNAEKKKIGYGRLLRVVFLPPLPLRAVGKISPA